MSFLSSPCWSEDSISERWEGEIINHIICTFQSILEIQLISPTNNKIYWTYPFNECSECHLLDK